MNYNEVWTSEKWTVEDLVDALQYRCVEPTEENVKRLLENCRGMFDDQSDRQEKLDNMVCHLFPDDAEW